MLLPSHRFPYMEVLYIIDAISGQAIALQTFYA